MIKLMLIMNYIFHKYFFMNHVNSWVSDAWIHKTRLEGTWTLSTFQFCIRLIHDEVMGNNAWIHLLLLYYKLMKSVHFQTKTAAMAPTDEQCLINIENRGLRGTKVLNWRLFSTLREHTSWPSAALCGSPAAQRRRQGSTAHFHFSLSLILIQIRSSFSPVLDHSYSNSWPVLAQA